MLANNNCQAVLVHERSFALNGNSVSHRFHVDEVTGDLISDHFGGLVNEDPVANQGSNGGGWSTQEHLRREFPDLGRGDFRSPAVTIKHPIGHTVSSFKYDSHSVINGKPGLNGLPSTFGKDDEVTTLTVRMHDVVSSVQVDLSYSIFPQHDAVARSTTVRNLGDGEIAVDKLASICVDLPYDEYEMLQLQGEWVRECTRTRRKVDYGMQRSVFTSPAFSSGPTTDDSICYSFGSTTGYSSHYNNPFLALLKPATTESHGDVWGFSLIYTGSFSAEVEKSPQGLTRVLLGMNPNQLSWPLKPGESLTSPECVSIFSANGVGDMSRKFHRFYRHHLITSKFVDEPRPALLNSWEGLYFDYDADTIYRLAQESAKLGVKLFVLDDGWFGVEHPRLNDDAGLGDWQANPVRFPDGLKSIGDKITKLDVSETLQSGEETSRKMQFGIWVEPEMVNRSSTLFGEHPDWVLSAKGYPHTETRQQLVLNVALPDVQEFIIESISQILQSAPITFVKWDNNRGIHESPSPHNYHAYILGLYRVLGELTSRFPNVIWEGCASGGGRFDPGILHYFPQSWTSDNTDALDRLQIQFGTSVVYPASSMGAHIGAVPYELTGRTTPIRFRAHVAMMGGSFGLELNPDSIPDGDKGELPGLIALAEKVNPIVIRGDLWRLSLPGESNHPAALFISEDGAETVLFLFQIRTVPVHNFPTIRLQGLDPSQRYQIDGGRVYSGSTLMNGGIQQRFNGDYDSKVMFLERV